jgi:hypothetical protein
MKKHYFEFIRTAISIFSAFVLIPVFAFAQSETGRSSLEGVVRDANGAVVQGAAINVRSTETGAVRDLTTNAEGRFVATVLPVGIYTVSARAGGFAETVVRAVLAVGETTNIEITVVPEGAEATVTVTGDQELIDTEEASAGASVSERAIADLPIRGRNYAEFVQLSPGIIQEGDRSGLVIAGQRSINSNVAIDGADFNDSHQGNQRGGNEAVFFFPQTAIRQFQVVRAGATAEVGRTNAGFVNAVTKSGSNEIRGEIFFFNRNARLTSPDAFGNDGDNNQNLIGGSIGGPIKKDRAFFFFGIEQNYLRIPYFVEFRTPQGVTLPSDLQALMGEGISSNDPTSLFGRLDFNLNQNNSLNFQYTFSRFQGDNFVVLDEGITLTDRANEITRTGRSHGFKGSLISVLSPNVINEFRGQIATDDRLEQANNGGPEVRIDGIGLPGSSNARFGGNGSRPRIFETIRYQLSDNVSWNTGRHRVKFGMDMNVNRFTGRRVPDGVGTWRFIASGSTSALENYVNRIPRRIQQTVLLIPELGTAVGYQKEYALFIQDRIKVSRNLTMNAGLRWEGQDNPTPPEGNPLFPETMDIPDDWKQWQPRLGGAWDIRGNGDSVLRISAGIYTARTPSNLFIRPFVENGVVSKFVRVDERSGGNCRISPTATNCVLRLNPDGTAGSNFVVAYPNLLTPQQATTLAEPLRQRIFGFDPDFKNPRSFQASATFEQRLGKDLTMSVGFIRNSTWNLQRRFNRNLLPPIPETDPAFPIEFIGTGYPVFRPFPGGRIDPLIDWFSVNESTAHSDYNALTLSLNRRFSRRYSMSANYTFSRTRDDDSNERNFSQELTLNPYDLLAEASYSKQDVRHNFNFSGVFDLGQGFTLSGILITRSGFPYTAVFGDDYNGDNNSDNDRAIVDGRVVGRNTLRQPNFFNLDLRLLKTFKFGERYGLALSAEVFNATTSKNKGFGADAISAFCTGVGGFQGPNPSGYDITCPNGTAPSISAGEAFTAPSTARFGGPRQLQLGARFSF